jgi:hypothetical protein
LQEADTAFFVVDDGQPTAGQIAKAKRSTAECESQCFRMRKISYDILVLCDLSHVVPRRKRINCACQPTAGSCVRQEHPCSVLHSGTGGLLQSAETSNVTNQPDEVSSLTSALHERAASGPYSVYAIPSFFFRKTTSPASFPSTA